MSTKLPAALRRHIWMPAVLFLLTSLWAEWTAFFNLWSSTVIYAHGFLVLAGVAYLLYRRRHSLAALTPGVSPMALVLLAGASCVLVLAQAADIRVIRLLLVPVIIILWGWSIWGRDFVRISGGPIMLLVFAVPLWDDLSPVLQHITVFFNTLLLGIAGVEATIREFYIILDVGTFLVENGCSGVRYMMVALFLGSFYGQLYYQRYRSTILLVVVAGLLSMVANWVRVFGIILAGHYTNMETSLVEDHELFGWVVFMIFTLIPLFLVSARLESTLPDNRRSARHQNLGTKVHGSTWWAGLACLMLAWPAALPLVLDSQTQRAGEAWEPSLFQSVPGWHGPLRHADIWKPDFRKPDINLTGVYVNQALQQVQLQIIGYRVQTQGRELIFFGNSLYDRAEWQLVSENTVPLETSPIPDLAAVSETIIKHRASGEQVIIWNWYEVAETKTHSPTKAKLVGALNKIRGDGRGALWALAGNCDRKQIGNCEAQRATFRAFLRRAAEG